MTATACGDGGTGEDAGSLAGTKSLAVADSASGSRGGTIADTLLLAGTKDLANTDSTDGGRGSNGDDTV